MKIVWEALKDISLSVNGLFWIAIGGFNEIRTPEECRGQGVYCHGGPSGFIHATNLSCMIELTSLGGDFTWKNNSPGENFR